MTDVRGTFVKTDLNLASRKAFVKELQDAGIPKRVAIAQYRKLKQDKVWVSVELGVQVNIDENPEHGFPFDCWHLSIKYFDKRPIHDWRILQRIKNELVGEECEAIELYPAESRVVDTANQYHLFVFTDPEIRVPCGWTTGAKSETSVGNSVQRPFDEVKK